MQDALDLTNGSPFKLMVRFSTPMLIGSIFQSLYTMVDAAVLGRYVGANALAAIGASSSTVNMITMVVTAFTSAVSVLVSQAVGSAERKQISNCVSASLSLCLFLSILLGLLSLLGAKPLMSLLQTPKDVFEQAVCYVQLIGGFCITMFAYNLSSAILRAIGDSKLPLIFLMICSLLNIALDLVAVCWLHLGIIGVAGATILSQAVCSTICWFYMFRKYDQLHITKQAKGFDRETFKMLLLMGLQLSFQRCLLSVGMLIITRVINGFGSQIVAAYTIGSNVQHLVTIALYSYVTSFTIFTGQNYGAQNWERIRTGFWQMAALTTAICVLATGLSLFLAEAFVDLYIGNADVLVRQAAVAFVRIQSYFYIFLGAIELYNATVRGLGKISISTISSLIELFAKVLGSILLAHFFGYIGIWYAAPIGWVLGILPSARYFHCGKWETSKKRMQVKISR